MSTAAALTEIELLLASGQTILYLHSPEEARWERELRGLAARAGVPLVTWSETHGLASEPQNPELVAPRALLDHLAGVTRRTWFLLADFHPHLGNPWVVRRLRELDQALGETRSAVLLIAPVVVIPPELERETALVELPLPEASDLRPHVRETLDRWRDANPSAPGISAEMAPELPERIERALLGLTERAAGRVLERSLLRRETLGPEVLRALLAEKRRVLADSELLEFVEPGVTAADLGGLDELKRWIERRGAGFTDAARERGLPAPAGLLILGVQGCGKSLASRVVADTWGFPLVRLDLSAVIRAERQGRQEGLKRALGVAERLAPAVLWVDELEKGFADAGGEGEGAVARALATFLTWMQEKKAPVFVVATANRVDRLPAELVRKGRFDEIFFVDLPTLAERRQIVAIHLAKRGLHAERFDVATLARSSAGLTGAEIEQAVLSAGYESFAEGRDATTADVLAAMKGSIPLAVTMAEQIDALREWAEKRTRPACLDNRLKDMIAETLEDETPEPEDALVKSLRCERCGFVQGARARCRKCGEELVAGRLEVTEPGEPAPIAERYKLEPIPAVPPRPPSVPGPAVASDAKASPSKDGKPVKPPPEPIARIRSVPLTADIEAYGATLIEFRCRKCETYGVLPVPEVLMEKGVEAECGSCRRVTPMTRVELDAKRMDRSDAAE